MSKIDSVASVKKLAETEGHLQFSVSLKEEKEVRPAIAKTLCENGIDLYEMTIQKNSLEDVFHALTAATAESEAK